MKVQGNDIKSVARIATYKNLLLLTGDSGDGVEPHAWNPETGYAWQIADMRPGTKASWPTRLTPFGNYMLFQANNEPYVLSSIDEAPKSLAVGGSFYGSYPGEFTSMGSECFFVAQNYVYSTDGESKQSEAYLAGDSIDPELCIAGGKIYVGYFQNTTKTGVLATINRSKPYDQSLEFFTSLSWTRSGFELPVRMLEPLGDKMVFVGDNGDGDKIYITNGTDAGTQLIHDPPPGSEVLMLKSSSSGAFYFIYNGSNTYLRWSNGNPGSDLLLHTFDTKGLYLDQSVIAQGRLWFSGDTQQFGKKPWVSDGTAAGTYQIVDNMSEPTSFLPYGDGVLFSAWESGNGEIDGAGRELIFSDGSPEGTNVVYDLVPGRGSGMAYGPGSIVAALDSIFFAGVTPNWGGEVWEWQGAGHDPERVTSLYEGGDALPISYITTAPMDAVEFQGALVFAADDGCTGKELWALVPGTPAQGWK